MIRWLYMSAVNEFHTQRAQRSAVQLRLEKLLATILDEFLHHMGRSHIPIEAVKQSFDTLNVAHKAQGTPAFAAMWKMRAKRKQDLHE